jgi:DNA-binding protein HU-beta
MMFLAADMITLYYPFFSFYSSLQRAPRALLPATAGRAGSRNADDQHPYGLLFRETITFNNIYANLRPLITKEVVMKKGELIAEFAKRSEVSAAAANDAVNTLIAIITERLKKGDTVGITGFGTFSVAKRAARKGRNPATGEAIKIAASKTPKFSAGATLKAAVNPKKK